MASTKNHKPKTHSGLTKAGRGSKSGGRNRGKNGVAFQGTVLVVPTKSATWRERLEIENHHRRTACTVSLSELRRKLAGWEYQNVLLVAEHMVIKLSSVHTTSDTTASAQKSVRQTLRAETEQHFRSRNFLEPDIRLGIRAALMEFDDQLIDAKRAALA